MRAEKIYLIISKSQILSSSEFVAKIPQAKSIFHCAVSDDDDDDDVQEDKVGPDAPRTIRSALVGCVCGTAGGIFIVAAVAFASAHASIADSYKLSPVSSSQKNKNPANGKKKCSK